MYTDRWNQTSSASNHRCWHDYLNKPFCAAEWNKRTSYIYNRFREPLSLTHHCVPVISDLEAERWCATTNRLTRNEIDDEYKTNLSLVCTFDALLPLVDRWAMVKIAKAKTAFLTYVYTCTSRTRTGCNGKDLSEYAYIRDDKWTRRIIIFFIQIYVSTRIAFRSTLSARIHKYASISIISLMIYRLEEWPFGIMTSWPRNTPGKWIYWIHARDSSVLWWNVAYIPYTIQSPGLCEAFSVYRCIIVLSESTLSRIGLMFFLTRW